MKKSINAIITELRLASTVEIELILKGLLGKVKKRTLFSNLKNLEEGKVILKLLPKESSYEVEGYMPGPNMQVEEDFDVKRVIEEQGVSTRDLAEIDWELFSSRVVDGLMTDLTLLKEDLEKTYDDPKSLDFYLAKRAVAEVDGEEFEYNRDFEEHLKSCNSCKDRYKEYMEYSIEFSHFRKKKEDKHPFPF